MRVWYSGFLSGSTWGLCVLAQLLCDIILDPQPSWSNQDSGGRNKVVPPGQGLQRASIARERSQKKVNTIRLARIFQKGGVTLCQSEGTRLFGLKVMAFSPPVLACLVKKGLQKGGSRAPQDPTGYALDKYS